MKQAGPLLDFGAFPRISFEDLVHFSEKKDGLQARLDTYAQPLRQDPTNLLWSLTEACGKAAELLKVPASGGDQICPGPYLVHIHIYADAKLFTEPIDLVRLTEGGFQHLCTQAPIVWRFASGNSPSTSIPRDWLCNPVRYYGGGFEALLSCEKGVQVGQELCEAIPNVRGHTCDLLRILGLPVQNPVHVGGVETIQEVFNRRVTGPNVVHLTAHGLRCPQGEEAAIALGPTQADGDAGVPLTAYQLGPDVHKGSICRQSSVRFAFFNACGLAGQLNEKEASGHIVGSFVEGLMRCGACAEAIAHRWSVGTDAAFLVATEFYRTKPVTVHGRAAALLRARLEVLKKHKNKEGEGHFWHTWMAPMHVWREE